LSVVTGRGLVDRDKYITIPGQSGIIGQALTQGIPVFGNDAVKDPELQYFVAFQGIHSVLCIPLRAGFDSFGVLLYGSDRANAFSDEHTEMLTAIGIQATVALQNSMLYRNLREERDRIVEVEEDARKKLARDLHDGPTQSIAAIAMRMGIIYKLLERTPAEVPAELKKVEDLARRTTKEIRHMLFTLRPLVLENQGLSPALDQLAEKMKETHNQNVVIRLGRDVEKTLDSHQQGVIFYIVEEAVGNARKHAQAELISVNLYCQDDVVVVKISDNGKGFDLGKVTNNYDQRGSLGMVNMRERAQLLDATLNIDSAPGQGTTITVYVPMKEAALAAGAGVDRTAARKPANTTSKLAVAVRERLDSL
jgi:signal transduction histidine kinase